jgi:sugar lactone lactonase YvrE
MNDGKCDGAGRFWAGTMSPERGDARLYRLDPDRSVRTMVEGVTCSNGLGWSLDERTMYYIDTPTRRIDAFDYDAPTGDISRRRTLIEVPREHGSPDGMALDESGCLWVAFWGGGAVRRYTPQGVLDRTVEVDATNVTSCAFGGSDRSELYITTAGGKPSPAEREARPHAGGVFVTRPGVKGMPVSAFAG